MNNDDALKMALFNGPKGIDISNNQYHSMPGISASKLELLAESNLHLDNATMFSKGNTPAMSFGSLFHTMTLEPHTFSEYYATQPNLDLRTNAGKAEKQRFLETTCGKTVVTMEDVETAVLMARNVHAITGGIIDAGLIENSQFVEVDGLLLKCRLDICDPDTGDDYDLKSITVGARPFNNQTLEYHIRDFNYARSAAFRNIVRKSLGITPGNSYLIFCDTGPGHRVKVVKLSERWIEEQELIVADMLDARRFYLKTGIDIGISEIDDSRRRYENNR